MRRTLALAGIAVLGVTGLAGPASADPGAGIHAADVRIVEVGAELDTTFGGGALDGGFVEIENIGDAAILVLGYKITACTASGSFDPVTIADNVTLQPGDTYLVGDDDYVSVLSATPNQRFATDEVLLQAAGGAELRDGSNGLVDEIMWGPDDPGVACADTNAGTTPTTTQSINFGDPWVRANPTPTPF